MDFKDFILFFTVILSTWLLSDKYFPVKFQFSTTPRTITPVVAQEALVNHSKEFEISTIKVTDGVYVAVGFGLANSILLEGDDGVIIVDVMENLIEGKAIKEEFSKITKKPVKAIIYTHYHADHVFGAKAFVDEGVDLEVIAHDTLNKYMISLFGITNEIQYKRSMHQFGAMLDKKTELINCGIGPSLGWGKGQPIGFIWPTKTLKDKLKITIAGLDLEIYHAPGETNDQIVVWIPSKKVLCAADNIYKSFPNIYAIRGTRSRDAMQWVESLDLMRALRPHYLVPSHTRPVTGEKEIADLLEIYRDGVQFIHDQTLRYMNKGYTANEIVPLIQLPPHLAEHPFLQPFYGAIEFSVRAIWHGEMGWFSGRAVDLRPTTNQEKANDLINLAGGWTQLYEKAKQAFDTGKHQWALELSEYLLLSQNPSEGHHDALLELKQKALRALATQQMSSNARNWYLTEAQETSGVIIRPKPGDEDNYFEASDIRIIFRYFSLSLIPDKVKNVDKVVFFVIADKNATISMHIRNGICDVKYDEEAINTEVPEFSVHVSSETWKGLATNRINAVAALAKGDIKVEGKNAVTGPIALGLFTSYFEPRR